MVNHIKEIEEAIYLVKNNVKDKKIKRYILKRLAEESVKASSVYQVR